jgi:DNA invertase Pin-like site-specific DNA recombinase
MLQEKMLTKVLGLGGELIFIGEPDLCDSDPTRVMFRHVRNAVNQYRRAMTIARQRVGRRGKTCTGGYPGGPLLYGYRAERTGRSAPPSVDLDEAEIVQTCSRNTLTDRPCG